MVRALISILFFIIVCISVLLFKPEPSKLLSEHPHTIEQKKLAVEMAEFLTHNPEIARAQSPSNSEKLQPEENRESAESDLEKNIILYRAFTRPSPPVNGRPVETRPLNLDLIFGTTKLHFENKLDFEKWIYENLKKEGPHFAKRIQFEDNSSLELLLLHQISEIDSSESTSEYLKISSLKLARENLHRDPQSAKAALDLYQLLEVDEFRRSETVNSFEFSK